MPQPASPKDPIDPRGLIREAYVIEGISEPECRSIFLDWAIGVPQGEDTRAHVATLLDRYGPAAPDHPMTRVLRDGLAQWDRTGRRGGRRGRVTD
ncbi:hypothetical protein ACRDNQ_13375 [Palleronia sp. KMU-117]|uniref:hypothetical protein n=1 Tax=Palleronia sp. KMU-117 TaxID=3434108 RepID=UPI003D709CF7